MLTKRKERKKTTFLTEMFTLMENHKRYVHSISQELHLFLGDSASQLLVKEEKNFQHFFKRFFSSVDLVNNKNMFYISRNVKNSLMKYFPQINKR